MSAPTIYDYCGVVGTVTEKFIAVPPDQLRTMTGSFTLGETYSEFEWSWSSTSGPPRAYSKSLIKKVSQKPLLTADLDCPTFGVGTSLSPPPHGYTITTFGPPYLPMVVPPIEFLTDRPEWMELCSGKLWEPFLQPFGVLDPPFVHEVAAQLAPDDKDPKPASAAADQAPITAAGSADAPNSSVAAPASSPQPNVPATTDPPSSPSLSNLGILFSTAQGMDSIAAHGPSDTNNGGPIQSLAHAGAFFSPPPVQKPHKSEPPPGGSSDEDSHPGKYPFMPPQQAENGQSHHRSSKKQDSPTPTFDDSFDVKISQQRIADSTRAQQWRASTGNADSLPDSRTLNGGDQQQTDDSSNAQPEDAHPSPFAGQLFESSPIAIDRDRKDHEPDTDVGEPDNIATQQVTPEAGRHRFFQKPQATFTNTAYLPSAGRAGDEGADVERHVGQELPTVSNKQSPTSFPYAPADEHRTLSNIKAKEAVGNHADSHSVATSVPFATLTIGEQRAVANAAGFYVASTSILPGAPAVTVCGTRLSLDASGKLIMGDKTLSLPQPVPTGDTIDLGAAAGTGLIRAGVKTTVPETPTSPDSLRLENSTTTRGLEEDPRNIQTETRSVFPGSNEDPMKPSDSGGSLPSDGDKEDFKSKAGQTQSNSAACSRPYAMLLGGPMLFLMLFL